MSKCIDNGPKHIVLDLSQIDFVDSSGLGALVQLVKKAQTNGGTLQIVSNPRVTQTVKLVRLEKFLSLQQTVEDAVAAVKKSWVTARSLPISSRPIGGFSVGPTICWLKIA